MDDIVVSMNLIWSHSFEKDEIDMSRTCTLTHGKGKAIGDRTSEPGA